MANVICAVHGVKIKSCWKNSNALSNPFIAEISNKMQFFVCIPNNIFHLPHAMPAYQLLICTHFYCYFCMPQCAAQLLTCCCTYKHTYACIFIHATYVRKHTRPPTFAYQSRNFVIIYRCSALNSIELLPLLNRRNIAKSHFVAHASVFICIPLLLHYTAARWENIIASVGT